MYLGRDKSWSISDIITHPKNDGVKGWVHPFSEASALDSAPSPNEFWNSIPLRVCCWLLEMMIWDRWRVGEGVSFIVGELLFSMFYCSLLPCSRLFRTCLDFEKLLGLAPSSDRLKSSGSLATQTRARTYGKTRVVDPLRETGAQISRGQQMSGSFGETCACSL